MTTPESQTPMIQTTPPDGKSEARVYYPGTEATCLEKVKEQLRSSGVSQKIVDAVTPDYPQVQACMKREAGIIKK